ncbi:MAG: 30S ribosomal protein S12 methylthiotransferase RimO [Zetaproteobacteria bacterium]|nr:30S ribosomal protein S12 methylthiotransferase RimO [Zetaproteobacteria bacterium]
MTNVPVIGFVSLGCPKATVDSERILTQLKVEGYRFSGDYHDADVVVINTCGFIESAVEESLDAIGEALEKHGKVIVTGCLGKNAQVVTSRHPGVLAVTGPHEYEAVMEAVHAVVAPPAFDPHQDLVPTSGVKLTPRHYAYLKISEGCNHSCSFCIIPDLRGKLVSRGITDVVAEAKNLVADGVKELLVVSQDTSAYGVDLKYRTGFVDGRPVATRMYQLAEELGKLDAWVRMHYVYPYPHVDDLIPLMRDGLILPYLDIPLQHASKSVLGAMKRPGDHESMLERIAGWRDVCPEIALRSTFIVGFPGESERDFNELLDFIRVAKLDRVGCFTYSDVAGAQANHLPNHLPEEEKTRRLEAFMLLQAEISAQKLAEKVGYEMVVLIDEVGADGAVGRTYADAPEVDGTVLLPGVTDVEPGMFVDALIVGSSAYDLIAEPVFDDA